MSSDFRTHPASPQPSDYFEACLGIGTMAPLQAYLGFYKRPGYCFLTWLLLVPVPRLLSKVTDPTSLTIEPVSA